MSAADVTELGRRAKAASRTLGTASTGAKNGALLAAADVLEERVPEILAANREDLDAAAAGGMEAGAPGATRGARAAAGGGGRGAGPLDRLGLTEARIGSRGAGRRQVATLPDPVGEVLDGWVRPNGLEIQRVRVPLGVVAIIYENRPNV